MEPSMTSQRNLELWAATIYEDEFDDTLQNKARGDAKKVDGWKALDLLSSMIPPLYFSKVLDVGCGAGHLKADYKLDPADRGSADSLPGWMENLPLGNAILSKIVCWGTFCFLRSPTEALMEANRVLHIGGQMIFDVVLSTTFPLCQTVHGPSFVRHLDLHGFEVKGQMEFGGRHHHRLGLVIIKTRPWSPARFRMPQAKERPLNYLKERDWPMWGGE